MNDANVCCVRQVQLGFSVICLSLLEREVGLVFSGEQRADMVHTWRVREGDAPGTLFIEFFFC